MAGAPQFKVYTPEGEYVAACKLPEDAAAVVAAYGPGATIRNGHRKKDVVYTEGVDGDAGDSYDEVARIVHERVEQQHVAARAWARSVAEPPKL